jgi:creatinine amidohydrolase
MSGVLTDMTLGDVLELAPEVVLLPVGSTEPHGRALPYGTDFFFADAVAREAVVRANAAGARTLMLPTLPIGNNVNFTAFPFACRIRVRTLMCMILDIIEALEQDCIRKIVILNGHGGNTATLQATLREHMERRSRGEAQAFVCLAGRCANPSDPLPVTIDHPSHHAGESEASRMMYLHPNLVKPHELADNPIKAPTIERLANAPGEFVPPWHLHMPESAGGDARTASAEKGGAIFENRVNGLAELLIDLSAAPWHPDFPYQKGAGAASWRPADA